MSSFSRSISRWTAFALLGLLLSMIWMPVSAMAQEAAVPGGSGTLTAAEPVMLRTEPGYDSAATTTLQAGTELQILNGPVYAADGSEWYQVDAWGQVGYAPSWAISGVGGAPAVSEPVADPEPVAETAETFDAPVADSAAPVGTAYVAATNGDGAVCRAAPSYDGASLGVITEGTAVDVTGGATGDWQPVNCNGAPGYINASYISWDAPVAADTAVIAEPVVDESIVAEPLVEEPVAIEEPVIDEPAPIEEPVIDEPVAAAEPVAESGGGGGRGIANFALQYEGSPYVYAGEGPYSFDCSGFTKFVIANTVGIDITHDMFIQYDMGTPVDRGSLRPGDLVFFQNTFRPGMSHNGIYIGNGQMIHAENETTGVKISDINSDYYSSRWYGAVRF